MGQIKPILREGLLEARLAMPIKDRQNNNKKITDNLIGLIDWKKLNNIHIFVTIAPLGEVDTEPFRHYLRNNYPRLNLYYPKKGKNGWQHVDDKNKVATNVGYDIIIVPTLGFDSSLNRVGYGGGYYDRFLATQKGAQFIGLSFDIGHVEDIPVEPHDIKLDYIVTEKQVYRGII